MNALTPGVTIQSVMRCNVHPRIHVADVVGRRRAQIIARLLTERTGLCHLPCDPAASERDGGRELSADTAVALFQTAAEELLAEAQANPDDLPKWLLLIFDHGAPNEVRPRFQFSLYLDHDVEVVRRCRANPSLIETIPVFAEAIDHLEAKALFDAFVAERMAQTGEGYAA